MQDFWLVAAFLQFLKYQVGVAFRGCGRGAAESYKVQ